jgi:hypothetical protein
MREYTDLGIRQDAANAQSALEALGVAGPQMQAAIDSIYEQDMGVDERAYQQWEDQMRLQSDLDWRADQSRNASLDLLLRALGSGEGGVPGYNVPGGESSFLNNAMQVWGAAQDPANLKWWPFS